MVGPYGVTNRLLWDDNGVTHITTQDVEPVLDHNQRLRNAILNPRSQIKPVASIPHVVHNRWRSEWEKEHSRHFTWPTYLAMKLNDRSYKYLKTTDKRV